MSKLILALTILLSACGGSSSTVESPKPVEPPIKSTLIIKSNVDNNTLDGSLLNYESVIIEATFSQVYRDSIADCSACFELTSAVILGGDIDCIDCMRLNTMLDYLERDNGVQVFITVRDELSFGFVEGLISQRGYSDIVIVSHDEGLLTSSIYNYPSAIIGESSNGNIDWHITSNSDCSAMCINPDGNGAGVFDGVIID